MSAVAIMAMLTLIMVASAAIGAAVAWTLVVRRKIRLLIHAAEILKGKVRELEAEIAKLKPSAQSKVSAE